MDLDRFLGVPNLKLQNQYDLDVLPEVKEEESTSARGIKPKGLHSRQDLHNDPIKPLSRLELEQELEEQERLFSIVQKEFKTDKEAMFIFNYLKNFAFMKRLFPPGMENEISMEIILQLCKNMKYEEHKKGEIIFKQGDPSNGKMYIVAQGEVAVVVKDREFLNKENMKKLMRLNTIRSQGTRRTQFSRKGTSKNESRRTRQTGTRRTQVSRQPSFGSRASRPSLSQLNDPRESSISSLDLSDSNTSAHQQLEEIMYPSIADSIINSKMELDNEIAKSKIFRPFTSVLLGEQVKQETAKNLKIISGIAKARNVFKKVLKANAALEDVIKENGALRDRIEKGGFFGDLALFTNQKRSATIIALKNTDCLVIMKEDFKTIKDLLYSRRQQFKEFILRAFPGLSIARSDRLIESILYLFEERTYEMNSCIVKEGQTDNNIYIISEGTCEISKDLLVDDSFKLNKLLQERKELLRMKFNSKLKVTLATAQEGFLFGEEPIFCRSKYMDFTVRVTSSKATVYCLRYAHFKMRFPDEAYQALKERYAEKLNKYLHIIKNLLLTRYVDLVPIDYNPLADKSRMELINELTAADLKKPLIFKREPAAKKKEKVDYLVLLNKKPENLQKRRGHRHTKSLAAITSVLKTEETAEIKNDISIPKLFTPKHPNVFSNGPSPIKPKISVDLAPSLLSPKQPTLENVATNETIIINDTSIIDKSFSILKDRPSFKDKNLLSPGRGGSVSRLALDATRMTSLDHSINEMDRLPALNLNKSVSKAQSEKPKQLSTSKLEKTQLNAEDDDEYEDVEEEAAYFDEEKTRNNLVRHLRKIRHQKDYIFPIFENENMKRKLAPPRTPVRSNPQGLFTTWKDYFKIMKESYPNYEEPRKDPEYINNISNFKFEYGKKDDSLDVKLHARKLKMGLISLPNKETPVGNEMSFVNSLKRRIKPKPASLNQSDFSSLIRNTSPVPESSLNQDTDILSQQTNESLKNLSISKQYPHLLRGNKSPSTKSTLLGSPIHSRAHSPSNELRILPDILSPSNKRNTNDTSETFVTTFETPSELKQEAKYELKQEGSFRIKERKSLDQIEILKQRKKINDIVSARGKLLDIDLNLTKTRYRPFGRFSLEGKAKLV